MLLKLLLVVMIGTTALLPRPATASAGEFLVSFGTRAVETLKDSAHSPDERERLFRDLFNEAADLPAISRFILGLHWRTASPRERSDFLAVFEDIAVQRFLPMFTSQTHEYSGEGFTVVDERPHDRIDGQVLVQTRIDRKEAAPVILIWRLREDNGQFKILDITVEGLSMVLTLRQEYGTAVRQLGGVAALVERLREKVRTGGFAPKSGGAPP